MNADAKDNPLKLSILDLATIYNSESATETLQNSTELVQLADKLGYTRYWFAEHHNTKHQVSTSPDLLAAHAAVLTENIRIGSGGVMLPNHSPLKVVENFSLLEALHPGRIDLGMGRAPGTDGITALALRRSREAVEGNDAGELLQELLAYFTRKFPEDHPFAQITPSADPSLIPELFMLGSSDGGMRIASQLGLGYAFAAQINPDWAIPALRSYREKFQPSEFLAEPYSIMSIIVVCAETDDEAAYLAGPAELQWVRWGTGQFQYAPPTLDEAASHAYTPEEEMIRKQNKGRFVIGSVEAVKKELLHLQKEAQIDEIMILNMITDKEARHQSFTLLADAFQLSGK
ncbi:N5,N10-methylene tetrahydromethanopterin reductase [Lentibacillus populi]|uniref:N5,N10-methylene tetrahydromethanopterin reductase n=1 Tax=Lentibacillus populi TaxID=1827502 RepID=A0A9W5TWG5_9BACI|nr:MULTISPECIES: LLM class flavin-dependent oxidoreductase [Bacillaceae]MBT2214716.1 LLM class flavin-dependent oxidoreductase [Virgibacillus dakarensis]GGB39390.1 N5,N10-methylene tetrahydromethanopterin reductase [Lentibacillus populi]